MNTPRKKPSCQKPSPTKAIPEKEAEVTNEPLSLRELSVYAEKFYSSFDLGILYKEFEKEGKEIILQDGSTNVTNYANFVAVIRSYLKITVRDSLSDAKESADDFLNHKRVELADAKRKVTLVNLILFKAHKLGRDKNYEKLSVGQLEDIVKIMSIYVPNSRKELDDSYKESDLSDEELAYSERFEEEW